MRARFRRTVLAAAVIASAACTRNGPDRGAPVADHDSAVELARWMEGAFSSRDQAAADPEFFDISLRMKRIWTDRADGPWLYVEQARADLLERPYRQRIYRLSRTGERTFRSDVYTLPEPVSRFVGCASDDARAREVFAALAPSDLRLLEGCAVDLRWDPSAGAFVGGTAGTGCASTREGAAYTTSQIRLEPGVLTSWDRGFDAAGNQVWGARSGGYRFVKISLP